MLSRGWQGAGADSACDRRGGGRKLEVRNEAMVKSLMLRWEVYEGGLVLSDSSLAVLPACAMGRMT